MQPEATYLMPELIPASPAELWAGEANGHAQHPGEEPPRVPLLPLDPGEADDTVRMLCAAGLPPESIMGAPSHARAQCRLCGPLT
jgi:hypothetical protein